MTHMTTKENIQSLFDAFKELTLISDYEAYESDVFLAVRSGFTSTPMFNFILATKAFDVKELVQLRSTLNVPFLFTALDPSLITPAIDKQLADHEIVLAEHVEASYFDQWDQLTMPELPDASYRIEAVTTIFQMNDFDRISSLCFHHERGLAAKFMRGLIINGFHSEHFKLYMGYLGKTPVNIGLTYKINKKVAVNMWGATHPDYQKKGFATLLAAYRMDALHKEGIETILCQNMAASKNMYQRLGFKASGSFPFYVSTVGMGQSEGAQG